MRIIIIYLLICIKISVDAAKSRKTYGPIAACRVGNIIPTMKLPPQLNTLPNDIAAGLGPTSNSSEPMKNGIGPRPIP